METFLPRKTLSQNLLLGLTCLVLDADNGLELLRDDLSLLLKIFDHLFLCLKSFVLSSSFIKVDNSITWDLIPTPDMLIQVFLEGDFTIFSLLKELGFFGDFKLKSKLEYNYYVFDSLKIEFTIYN